MIASDSASASATVIASPSGLTVATPTPTTTTVRVWISGGVAGVDYILACTALTNGGRTVRRSARLPVSER